MPLKIEKLKQLQSYSFERLAATISACERQIKFYEKQRAEKGIGCESAVTIFKEYHLAASNEVDSRLHAVPTQILLDCIFGKIQVFIR